jgi:predicted DNA-binding transcriptional regulator AlpA
MSEPEKTPSLLGNAFREELAAVVKEAVREAMKTRGGNGAVEDRLLDAPEAAKLLSVSPDWLYHNCKKLPFTRKLGHKLLRFSYQGILKWMDSKRLT